MTDTHTAQGSQAAAARRRLLEMTAAGRAVLAAEARESGPADKGDRDERALARRRRRFLEMTAVGRAVLAGGAVPSVAPSPRG